MTQKLYVVDCAVAVTARSALQARGFVEDALGREPHVWSVDADVRKPKRPKRPKAPKPSPPPAPTEPG